MILFPAIDLKDGKCVRLLKGDMEAETGRTIESTILAKDPKRPNLIARLKGAGQAPPLLLQGRFKCQIK